MLNMFSFEWSHLEVEIEFDPQVEKLKPSCETHIDTKALL